MPWAAWARRSGPARKPSTTRLKGVVPQPGTKALGLALGAGPGVAEAAEAAVGAGLDQEDVDLVAGDASAVQGQVPGAAELAQPVQRVDPDGQVEVPAFAPDRDPRAPERMEARDLLPERAGDRPDDGDRLHFLEGREGVGDHVGGGTELRRRCSIGASCSAIWARRISRGAS